MAANDPRLQEVLTTQHGLLLRRQALAGGLTGRQIHRRIRKNGPWQRVLPEVYAALTGPLTQHQLQLAALLYGAYAGAPHLQTEGGRAELDGAMLTGGTALRWVGFRTVPAPARIQVAVPHRRQIRSYGFVEVHRTCRWPPRLRVNDLPVVPVAMGVGAVCRSLHRLPDVRAVVAEAVQRGFTTVARLADEVRDGPHRHGALLRQAVAEVGAGVRSAPEARLRDILCAGGLSGVEYNADVHDRTGRWLARVDALVRDVRLVLEVDSREWHLSPSDWAETLRRHNRLEAAGFVVLHYLPSDLASRPDHVGREVRKTYERLATPHRRAV